MHWSKWMRQSHRWLAITPIITVTAATFAAAVGQGTDSWWYHLPLPPLFLLMFTGLCMFMLPYAMRWRGGQRTSKEA